MMIKQTICERMQKQQRPQTRTEGNIVYIIRQLRKDSGVSAQAAPASLTKPDNQSAVANPALFKVEEKDFAEEARRAEKEGNEMLKERICSEGISHYARALRGLYDPNDHVSSKENLVRSSGILRSIAELYGIWGYEAARKSYLRLSRIVVELAIEIK